MINKEPNYAVKNKGLNRSQRNAQIYGDKTSGVKNKSIAGVKMRSKVQKTLRCVVGYQNNINKLYRRAGIQSRL